MNKRVCDHEGCECDAPRHVNLNPINNLQITCLKIAGYAVATMFVVWAVFKILW